MFLLFLIYGSRNPCSEIHVNWTAKPFTQFVFLYTTGQWIVLWSAGEISQTSKGFWYDSFQ